MGTARVAPPTDVSAEPRRRLASFIDFEATDSKDLGYLIELSAKAAQAANHRDCDGRRSTIVGLPPSAVPNFAQSLTVVARRGFADAA